VFVELVVNPIEGSASFDAFMSSLWKYLVELYEKWLGQ
jgi:hypothetical protein